MLDTRYTMLDIGVSNFSSSLGVRQGCAVPGMLRMCIIFSFFICWDLCILSE